METILIKCPHCGEEMQAPAERESILCMFCGERIYLTAVEKTETEAETAVAKEQTDAGKCYENLNFVLEHVGAACKDYSQRVRAFKKDSYHELFERYKEENYAFYTAVKIVLDNAPDSVESLDGIYHQIASGFIREQEAKLEQVKKKNEKFTVQMDKNMFMAVYVLPSIKEIGGKKRTNWRRQSVKNGGRALRTAISLLPTMTPSYRDSKENSAMSQRQSVKT